MYRKTRQRLMAILAAAFILSGSFPAMAAKAEQMPEKAITEDGGIDTSDEEITEDSGIDMPGEEITEDGGIDMPGEEITGDGGIDTSNEEITEDDDIDTPDEEATEEAPSSEISIEAPAFEAHIEFWAGTYKVIGTFTDFTPDTSLIQTLYSLDGKNWQTDTDIFSYWHLPNPDSGSVLKQACILNAREPLKSYIAGEIDRFYLKLRVTRESGLSCETQTAAIERGGLQTLPEGTQSMALFSPSITVKESISGAPYRYRCYAGYQLTVPADATVEDITTLLPKTLPVEIQFHINTSANLVAIGVIDCPVIWKTLSLPRLSPGETVTIPDAAEEINIPAGTQVSTPLGIFQLEETLSLDQPPFTDEVRLILNVTSAEGKTLTGVLKDELRTLKIALYQKPTGAASIRAYILTEGESAWMELSGLSLLKEFYQPSTESTGYALLLRDDQEPYRSYLAATEAGEAPTPFFVGLTIEGGFYDGEEIILSWPDVYEELPDLPKIRGSQGNEGNAGADNKGDSTESGQRPNLPQVENNGLEEAQQASNPDVIQEEPYTPASAQETDSVAPENLFSSSSDEFVSNGSSVGQTGTPSGQRPNLPDMTPDSSDTGWRIIPELIPPVVQAAAGTEEEGNDVPLLSDSKTTVNQTAKSSRQIPVIPVTTAAVGCIGIAFCKSAGYSLFRRISETIWKILHR